MPFASHQKVLASLPQEAKQLWLRVGKSALAAESSEEQAAKIAWQGLSNAGWTKNRSDDWVRVDKRRVLLIKRRGIGTGRHFGLRVPIHSFSKKGESLQVFGWASVAVDKKAQIVVDHGKDDIPVSELEKACYEFCKRSGTANVLHKGPDIGRLIECACITPEKRVAMGLDGTGKTGMWVGFDIRDSDAIAKIRSGELSEFSIEGEAERHEVEKQKRGSLRELKIYKVALVDAGEGKGVTIELFKRKGQQKMKIENFLKTFRLRKQEDAQDPAAILDAILAKLTDEERAVVQMALEAAAGGAAPASPEADKQEDEEEPKLEEEEKQADEEEEEKQADEEEEEEEEEEMAKLSPQLASKIRKNSQDLAQLKKAEKRREFVKVAKAFDAIPGLTTDQLADTLIAAESALTKSQYQDLIKGYKIQAAAFSALMKGQGSSRAGAGDGSGEHELDALAKQLQDKDSNLSYEAAYTKAAKTPEGRSLVAKSLAMGDD